LACGFPEDVCSLSAHSAWRGEQKAFAMLVSYLSYPTVDVYLLLFSCSTFSIQKWFLRSAPKGWIWQSNRFHHFPDCAGTVKIQ